jgi:hypothetical protein
VKYDLQANDFQQDRNLPTPAALITKPQPERKQISARITAATYRQLKARAALEVMTVQTFYLVIFVGGEHERSTCREQEFKQGCPLAY